MAPGAGSKGMTDHETSYESTAASLRPSDFAYVSHVIFNPMYNVAAPIGFDS